MYKRKAGVCTPTVIYILGAVFMLSICPSISTAQLKEGLSVSSAIERAEGIASDGKHLWMLDGKKKELSAVDPGTGGVTRTVPTALKQPKGAVYDGKQLWVGDLETKTINAIEPETGRTVKTLKMELPGEKALFEGLAWDGKYLWAAYAAGFSSSYQQIDTESGKVVRSIFADCDPRGIASDGEFLYSICYNGPKLPAKIDQRKILDKEHEMLRSRSFIKKLAEKDPSGLAYDGNFLWYLDRASKKAFKFSPKDVKK
jgi:hypothetical protein